MLSVSDFQGFESYRPPPLSKYKVKIGNPPVYDFPSQEHHHHRYTLFLIHCSLFLTFKTYTLVSSLLDSIHTPFTCLAFFISANWTPPLLSGPGSFTPLAALSSTPHLFQQSSLHFQPRPNPTPIFTPLFCSSICLLVPSLKLFVASCCEEQRYIHSSRLDQRDSRGPALLTSSPLESFTSCHLITESLITLK